MSEPQPRLLGAFMLAGNDPENDGGDAPDDPDPDGPSGPHGT